MRFALTDFFQDGVFRVFAFDRVPASEGSGRYWVKADMTLARRYGISLQELPLLCRAALETGVTTGDQHTITYTVTEMMEFADKRAAAAAARQRKPHPPRRARPEEAARQAPAR